MKISSMFSGGYLKASDLGEGKAIYTIEGIEQVSLKNNKGEEQIKPVVVFQGGEQLVLNKTNASAVSRALGSDETDDWLGRKITLAVKLVEFKGDWVDAIRVEPKAPGAAPGDDHADGVDGDDIPF